ncbi:hypothetical protein ASG37_15440 [Sphingomonas sp. Leaf407]|uniref:hypothetical protein n=1 Tax=unclassified Sphingomonas TaxID=196159 RepID=UPI0006FDC164|nr:MULTISPECIES: hypothetical protein [unclassified Sphingomonas]KQN35708.1 hypothetical protein ASE97_14695 [Sphingomonas sp. Leaf42]KQT26576.1 hypothetical protein ASG37_15440 [Sphingomonas sp. Leaf407]
MQTPTPARPAPSPALQPLPEPHPLLQVDPPTDTPYIDAHGFDPAAYEWIPVKRKPRSDGWTEARQREFIEALADGGSVDQAARSVGMSRVSAYGLRRAEGGEPFAHAWDAAIAQAVAMLVDVAFERAVNGSEEVVFDRNGRRVGLRHRHGDRMLMFLLAAHYPDRYGHHARARSRGAPDPARVEVAPVAAPAATLPDEPAADRPRLDPPLPLAQALERLAPVAPAEPHRAIDPADLDTRIACADILDGRLPRWCDPHRPQPEEPLQPPIHIPNEDDGDDDLPYIPAPGPLGVDFEIQLALAKRAAATGLTPDHPGKRARRRKARRV